MANVTYEELNQAMNNVEAIAKVRAEAVQSQMSEIRGQYAVQNTRIDTVLERLAAMQTDAKWFRRFFGATVLVLNVILGYWIKGFFG